MGFCLGGMWQGTCLFPVFILLINSIFVNFNLKLFLVGMWKYIVLYVDFMLCNNESHTYFFLFLRGADLFRPSSLDALISLSCVISQLGLSGSKGKRNQTRLGRRI